MLNSAFEGNRLCSLDLKNKYNQLQEDRVEESILEWRIIMEVVKIPTKCVKLKILAPIDSDWEQVGKILRDLRYNSSKMLNLIIQRRWERTNFKNSYKKDHGVYPENDKEFGNGLRAECTKRFQIFNADIIDATCREGRKRWNADEKDILSLKKSIPSYKLNAPIYIKNSNVKIIKENSRYLLSIGLLSRKYAKEHYEKKGRYQFEIAVKDNGTKGILERMIDKTYKQGQAQIIQIKNHWYVIISYTFKSEKVKQVKGRIMGIDMGIVYPVYMAFNDIPHRYKIKGGEIERFRRQQEKRKNELYDQGKYCADGRRGHGTKCRIKPIGIAKKAVKNFTDTINHKYSRFVIDMAVKHQAEVIQMELLEGIAKETSFLKNWPYYDLQQKIEYKAKEKGIEVIYINPQYTSQRCSKCGYIHKENREVQSKFLCQSCEFETNADYNAAKNISIKDIDQIIKKEMEESF